MRNIFCFVCALFFCLVANADDSKDYYQDECAKISAFNVEYSLPCGLTLSHKDGIAVLDNFFHKKVDDGKMFMPFLFRFGKKDERFSDYAKYIGDNKKLTSCSSVDVMLIENITADGLSVGIAYNDEIYLLFSTMNPEWIRKFFRC